MHLHYESIKDDSGIPFDQVIDKAQVLVDRVNATNRRIQFSIALPLGRFAASDIKPSINLNAGESTHIGGIGVTSRFVEDNDKDTPGLLDLLKCTNGKIIFLGNGLSDYPLETAERHKAGELLDVPIVVDVFDYREMHREIESLIEILRQNSIAPPPLLLKKYERLTQMIKMAEDGHLKFVQHIIGHNQTFPEILNCDLAVNAFGPSINCLQQQLELLNLGGKLCIYHLEAPSLLHENIPDGFERSYIVDNDSSQFIFRKIA